MTSFENLLIKDIVQRDNEYIRLLQPIHRGNPDNGIKEKPVD